MTEKIENKEKICGIIRPIAKMNDFYTFEHWNSVKDIMERAISKAGYTPLTVSDSKGSSTIHTSIFLNLYQNEIVVCDVSNRNANVMFELGMRIAFDKPVVIIKDEKTPFSFDTSHIKHLEYPSDLRFQVIEQFIEDLANLILETVEASKQKDYKTFLSHYAPIKVTTLETNEVSGKIALESILESISRLEENWSKFKNNQDTHVTKIPVLLSFSLPDKFSETNLHKIILEISNFKYVRSCEVDSDLGHYNLRVVLDSGLNKIIIENIESIINLMIKKAL